jgi:hypothetical protein
MKNNIDKMDATVRGHLRSQLTPYAGAEVDVNRIDAQLVDMSSNRMFDLYMREIGIIGFTNQILHALSEINKACNSNLGE